MFRLPKDYDIVYLNKNHSAELMNSFPYLISYNGAKKINSLLNNIIRNNEYFLEQILLSIKLQIL